MSDDGFLTTGVPPFRSDDIKNDEDAARWLGVSTEYFQSKVAEAEDRGQIDCPHCGFRQYNWGSCPLCSGTYPTLEDAA